MLVLDDPLGWPSLPPSLQAARVPCTGPLPPCSAPPLRPNLRGASRRARPNAARRARQCTRTAAPLEVRTSQAAAVRVPYVGPRQPPTAASAAGARHARPCAAKRPRRALARSCAAITPLTGQAYSW
eukprot:scaffold18346_cov54-Phaeocystis_antarctica.AAC.1